MNREEFTTKVKRARLKHATDAAGVVHCEICSGPITADGDTDYDHDSPWYFSRDSSFSNCRVCHRRCHGGKTATQDAPRIAKSRRQRDRKHGIKPRKGRPMPGSRASEWKRKLDGTIVKRER